MRTARAAFDDDPAGGASVAPLVPAHASPHPLSRLAPKFDLVDAAREIEQADRMLGAVVGGQLELIAQQIRELKQKAEELLEGARVSAELHRAACHFVKRPGHIYHLYRRPDGGAYFSLLSPAEWSGEPPHRFEGSFRLELDLSFKRVDQTKD